MLKKLSLQVMLVLIGAFIVNVNAQTTTVGTISGTIRDEREQLFPGPTLLSRVKPELRVRCIPTTTDFIIAASLPAGRYYSEHRAQRFQEDGR